MIALVLFLLATPAHAATLTLSSNTTTVTAGDIVTVTVWVNSSDEAINAAEGTLQFPSDELEALSIDKSNSVFSIWVQDPTFSNSTGEVDFSGGLPTPGYQGDGGEVLSVSFLAKSSGTATLSLADAEVNANDGMGTDVLTSTGTLGLTVTNPAATPPVVTTPTTPTTPSTSSTQTSQTSQTSGTSSDTTPPVVSSSSFSYDAATGMLSVWAKAKDPGSGVASYSVSIDGGPLTTVPLASLVSDTLQVPEHTSGTHTVVLTVTDNAGNKTSITGTFTVPSVPSPSLIQLPTTMVSGDQLIVQGTVPQQDTSVYLYIVKDGVDPPKFSVTPDSTGSFTLLGPILQKGTYDVWAVGVSAGGILSAPTQKMQIIVNEAPVLSAGPINLTLTEVLLILFLFSLGSFIAAALGWYKVYTYNYGHRHAVAKVKKDVHRALGVFKDDIKTHLDTLDHADTERKLGAAEAKLREDLDSNMADLEKYIDGEVS